MNKDRLTTILGIFAASTAAATPVINGMQNSSLHSQDYFQLGMALMIGLMGYFSNKKDK